MAEELEKNVAAEAPAEQSTETAAAPKQRAKSGRHIQSGSRFVKQQHRGIP